jgi:hypothetical protein
VAKEPGHRGEHEVSRKPSRRESRNASVEPVVLPPCFLLHGTHGCNQHPAFPVPSDFEEGETKSKARAQRAARTRTHTNTPPSCPRRRASSIRQPLGSSSAAPGILDRPPSRTMTAERSDMLRRNRLLAPQHLPVVIAPVFRRDDSRVRRDSDEATAVALTRPAPAF